ncbi:MAG TPA: protein kinase, partial [Urbifossiella sp.]|nr:protein kinase [Urbifossiella sp.]
GPLAVTLACHFARQTALGLQHAFEKGMVHRDIKPQNLMVTRKGQVKILDFGLARLALDAEAGKPPSTSPSLLLGTPDFLSPEQARNPHDVDIRSDLYSLGCTLYALLTGRPPFSKSTTLIDKLLAHTEEQADPLSKYRGDVPETLAAVVGKLMAKRPEDRYATPAEAAAALAPFAKGQESVAQAPAAFEVIEAPEPAPILPVADFRFGDAAEKKPKKRKKPRRRSFLARNRVWFAAAASAILLALIVGAVVKGTRGPRSAENGKETAEAKASVPPTLAPPRREPAASPAKKVDASVLIIFPSFDLAMDDYQAVRRRLEEAGVRIFTASGPPSFGPKSTLRPDFLIRPETDLSPYKALVFVGRDPLEFTRPQTGGAFAAQTAIEKMQNQNGVLAAIGGGEAALALHGVLTGKSAAVHAPTRDLPDVTSLAIQWKESGVVVDGKVITAADTRDAAAFADAIVKLLR